MGEYLKGDAIRCGPRRSRWDLEVEKNIDFPKVDAVCGGVEHHHSQSL